MKRRLAAIMVGDIVGLLRDDGEVGRRGADTTRRMRIRYRAKCVILDGRIFNKAGDATLAEFASPINALRCAVGIGVELASIKEDNEEPLKMRFGVHLADVVEREGDLLGDGVNLTARLQQAATPGAVWVSGALFDQFGAIRRLSSTTSASERSRTFPNPSTSIRCAARWRGTGCKQRRAAPPAVTKRSVPCH